MAELTRWTNSSRTRLPAKVNQTMINKVVPWVEEFWHAKKRFPSDSEFLTKFNFGGVARGEAGASVETELLQKLKLTRQFRAALKARGIENWNPVDPSGSFIGESLSAEQVAAISVLTNFSDTRPTAIKLNQLGVSPEQIQGWMVDPHFQRSLAGRADEQLNNIYPEAVTSLNRTIKKGNVAAIKFYFELTGRVQTQESVNLRLAMQHLIEAVQRHVHDPLVLSRIAQDFQAIQAINSATDEKAG